MKFYDPNSWSNYWAQLRQALLDPKVNEAALEKSLREAREKIPVPVFWLLGKTQAGKTSIISALTGSDTAEIGNGFQPCTRYSSFYDFPADVPIVRFLDTRGLGEIDYDPGEDIRFCETQAHLLLAVMKVADQRQEMVFSVLERIRRRHPEWPLLIAQTGLHELYPPGGEHINPWPYGIDPLPPLVSNDVRQAILAQRHSAKKIPGSAPINWVAIDLTTPEDGFEPLNYGLEALWQAIEYHSSFGWQQLLSGDKEVHGIYSRVAHQHIVGYSMTAAGLGALPVVDLVAVSGVQVKLLHGLAALYGQQWEKNTITEFIGLMGAGIATSYLTRVVGRTIAKVLPFWGQTVGAVWSASSSGATTYALGKAAVYFFARRKDGLNVDPEIIRRIYSEALARGATILKTRLRGGES
jgi:uncharacterized protein (DUF697 family)/predicted GTPase